MTHQARHASCLICGSDSLVLLGGYEKDFLVKCANCGFVFSGQIPSKEELDVIYEGYRRGVERTEASRKKFSDISASLHGQTRATKVLDIACGDGYLVSEFKKFGCEIFGSEFDRQAEEICSEKGIKMLPGGIMISPEQNDCAGYFDLVLFTEVIEHINNPREVINNIAKLTMPGGYLYITTPNFGSLERRLLKSQWGMICYPEHISYYTPRTLRHLMELMGYEEVWVKTENVSIFRLIQWFNDWKRQRQGENASSVHINAEEVSAKAQAAVSGNKSLSMLKVGVNYFLNSFGLGSSLSALYVKK